MASPVDIFSKDNGVTALFELPLVLACSVNVLVISRVAPARTSFLWATGFLSIGIAASFGFIRFKFEEKKSSSIIGDNFDVESYELIRTVHYTLAKVAGCLGVLGFACGAVSSFSINGLKRNSISIPFFLALSCMSIMLGVKSSMATTGKEAGEIALIAQVPTLIVCIFTAVRNFRKSRIACGMFLTGILAFAAGGLLSDSIPKEGLPLSPVDYLHLCFTAAFLLIGGAVTLVEKRRAMVEKMVKSN
ncbi:hypothetical protein CYMTET_5131 [Cymbomonas tetramitiformis]|uniref:Uncharacterized protein n=1 Tax=Cymbomonas tetramitiformis TaxID=36881 RepID=A0AAE0GZS1_9CHLO|nr:hypothetical protein CYMTET_5131 [Cymbomonas tetramitiformis]